MGRWLSRLSLLSAIVAVVLAATALPVSAGLGASQDAASLLGSYLAGRVARGTKRHRRRRAFYGRPWPGSRQ